MIRPYVLSDTNWKHLKDENFELAVLPWGATEAHNYHLPYATDNIEGTAIAEEAGRIAWEKGAKVIILPTIPFGVNTGQKDIYLDINLNPTTQLAILRDILTVLNRQGIKKFMLLNSHGGNNWKAIIRQLGLEFSDMFLCVSDWFKLADADAVFEHPGDHAGEMETSMILHLAPNLVLPKEEWGDGKERKNIIAGINEGWVWSERPWSKITEDTGVGNPKLATAEKGKEFFAIACTKMAQLFIDIVNTNPDERYR